MNKIQQIILETPRLIIRTPKKIDWVQFKKFDDRNIAHLSAWRSMSQKSQSEYESELEKWEQEFQNNNSIRFMLFLKKDPDGNMIGVCNFSQIFRGLFQACYLGYHIDSAFEGKGLMSEAVEKSVEYMFEEQNIHRIMANHMPFNDRSARLLSKLGFTIEGHAKNYLLINGRWEDHILTSLTNENWKTF